MPVSQSGDYMCFRCGKHFKNTNNFYKANNGAYKDSGYLPICKDCLAELYDQYCDMYGDERRAVQRLCMLLDLYYNDKIYSLVSKKTPATILGNYIKYCNMRQYLGKSFDTSLQKENFEFNEQKAKIIVKPIEIAASDFDIGDVRETGETESELENDEPEISDADILKWGAGLEYEDYEVLNNHYKGLMNANPGADSNQLIFIKNLCYTMMFQMRALRENDTDTYQKMANLYMSTFTKSKLQMAQETTSAEDFKMGVNIETIEQFTPAEYYKDKKLFKDYDGLGEYAERFILRPLRNLMHGTTDRDYEYYVKDEEGDGDTNG